MSRKELDLPLAESEESNEEPKPESEIIESKHDKFKRLAVKRTQKTLKAMDTLLNLANKNQYESTKEEKTKIITALKTKLDQIEKEFMPSEQVKTFNL